MKTLHTVLNVHKNAWIFSNKDTFHFSLQYYHKFWVGILHKNNEREMIHKMFGKNKIAVTVLPASWFRTFKWKKMFKTTILLRQEPKHYEKIISFWTNCEPHFLNIWGRCNCPKYIRKDVNLSRWRELKGKCLYSFIFMYFYFASKALNLYMIMTSNFRKSFALLDKN